ncbi:hypothetical protein XENTR_v10020867 [Xenopus tropicalis]|nr:hypothetical protein XENTR_v10020867 [Xenopus tropicalis]
MYILVGSQLALSLNTALALSKLLIINLHTNEHLSDTLPFTIPQLLPLLLFDRHQLFHFLLSICNVILSFLQLLLHVIVSVK